VLAPGSEQRETGLERQQRCFARERIGAHLSLYSFAGVAEAGSPIAHRSHDLSDLAREIEIATLRDLGQMTLEQLLRAHDFAKGLAQSQTASLATLATEVHFDEGQRLFGGGLSEYLYLLISGSVAVELIAPQLTLTVQVLGPGQVFGWSGVLEDQYSFFQVRARERVSALRIRGSALAQRCRAEGRLASELMLRTLQLAADRVKATEARFAEMCVTRPFGQD
jgi:CRP/FNR family transcriptional regulator, cyclic AMP receptor protein